MEQIKKHWQGWMIAGVKCGFRTKAAAERHISETGLRGVAPIRVKGPKDQLNLEAL
jgi:hypothetical protein